MKCLSLLEFRNYCVEKSFDTFIYTDENQKKHQIDDYVNVEMCFNNIVVSFDPNVVLLKNNSGILKFNNVTTISLDTDKCMLGEIFTLNCANACRKSKEKGYVLIAR